MPRSHGGEFAIVGTGVSKFYKARDSMFEAPTPLLDRLMRRHVPGGHIEPPDGDDDDDLADDDVVDDLEPAPASEGRWGLRHVSFSAYKGSIVLVTGAAGAGKSTLLGILGGTLYPTAGRVEVFGRISPPADFLLYFLRSDAYARQNLGVLANAMQMRRRQLWRHADAIYELAGGEAPTSALAHAALLYSHHDILLLDEPFAGLSPDAERRLLDRLRSLREEGRTLFIAAREALPTDELADLALVLDRAELAREGHPSEVVRQRAVEPELLAAAEPVTLYPERPLALRGFNKRGSIISVAANNVPSNGGTRPESVSIRVAIEIGGYPLKARCAFGLARPDGTGAWLQQQEDVELQPNGLYAFTAHLPISRLEPGDYTGRVELCFRFGEEISTIGRDRVLATTIPLTHAAGQEVSSSYASRYGVTWTERLASWTVEELAG
jgi:ABC-type multidrug transport system ATPase subunit